MSTYCTIRETTTFSVIDVDAPLALTEVTPEEQYQNLFRDVPYLKTGQANLTNGEISFQAMRIVLDLMKERGLQAEGRIFYDLGSGSGKPCVAMALLHGFKGKREENIYREKTFLDDIPLKIYIQNKRMSDNF